MSSSQNTNPLLTRFEVIQSAISKFKDEVKKYYFAVLLNRYRCHKCNNKLKLVDSSLAKCDCGLYFDPTIEFQRCPNCKDELVRKTFHYACGKCNNIVPSKFLFDEKVFNNEYFQEKMRISRDRKKREKTELQRFLKDSRSGILILNDYINFDNISGFEDDLNGFIGISHSVDECQFDQQDFVFCDYRSHLLRLINEEILFNSIPSLDSVERKDKIFRFIALIFMEQDREVWLSQQGEDILVKKYEAI